MPANKNQIRRIQTLLKMMRQNRYPNYTSFIREMKNQDIAGIYNISAKTFQRDVADLRDEYGAPIHYDASRKGFYLSNIGVDKYLSPVSGRRTTILLPQFSDSFASCIAA